MSNDVEPSSTITQPEYHAWKKEFKQDRGRDPTPYEAWVAGVEHGRKPPLPESDMKRIREVYGEPVFQVPPPGSRPKNG
ncbi:hypothetical protein F3K02_12415 [Hydrogenophaga sp. D2P1]|uniref:Uncharacterized protein n=1 Tax=Hydrogenophaga aromaticivorans TaxID=2610898 RepID=A0A7Y8KYE7_9BURK|nr:hypothetical protein [Hydrogenophaga aromaticivorans]NWF46048.1 hypothetical protein [Hydrogenophaga aromaticivorans]